MAETLSYTLLPVNEPFGPDDSAANQRAAQLPLRTFSDVAWDFAAGDIETPRRIIRGVDAILQNLRIRLGMFLGEWFLNTDEGMPYRTRIWGNGRDLRIIRTIFRRAILSTPGIGAVEGLTVVLNHQTRRAEVRDFIARLDTGERLIVPPFVVA